MDALGLTRWGCLHGRGWKCKFCLCSLTKQLWEAGPRMDDDLWHHKSWCSSVKSFFCMLQCMCRGGLRRIALPPAVARGVPLSELRTLTTRILCLVTQQFMFSLPPSCPYMVRRRIKYIVCLPTLEAEHNGSFCLIRPYTHLDVLEHHICNITVVNWFLYPVLRCPPLLFSLHSWVLEASHCLVNLVPFWGRTSTAAWKTSTTTESISSTWQRGVSHRYTAWWVLWEFHIQI